MSEPEFKQQDERRGRSPADYWPLLSLVLVSAAAAFALDAPDGFSPMQWMHYFMGFFFCVFALLKLFHPVTFADGFQMYDLLARRWRGYAYAYPLIELGLGLGYFSFWQPLLIYGATVAVMGFGAIGVVTALRRGLDINCPCMGSVLDVPLSTVTLSEDLGMGLMAVAMLAMRLL